jgi:hypothetical protein
MVNKNIAHILGIVAVLGLVTFLVAGDRNKFPGRRQGGGSRGAVPTHLISPEVCVAAGCEPLE